MNRKQYKSFVWPLTSKQVAQMTGMSTRTVEKWNSGRSPVPKWFIKNVTKEKIQQKAEENLK